MEQSKTIQRWRQAFTVNNRRLWEVRQTTFNRDSRGMLRRLERGGQKALTDLANELVEAGVYAKSGKGQREYMVLKRLFNHQSKYATWEDYLQGLNIPVAH